MRLTTIAIIAGLVGAAGLASAQEGFGQQLKARQGQFQIMALSIGTLGGMARGNIPYDEALAVSAAENMVAISNVNPGLLWPEGSDSMSIEGTRALPSIWDDNADFVAKWTAYGEAVSALPAAVTGGVENIGPALGPVGQTCNSCHEAHRVPDD